MFLSRTYTGGVNLLRLSSRIGGSKSRSLPHLVTSSLRNFHYSKTTTNFSNLSLLTQRLTPVTKSSTHDLSSLYLQKYAPAQNFGAFVFILIPVMGFMGIALFFEKVGLTNMRAYLWFEEEIVEKKLLRKMSSLGRSKEDQIKDCDREKLERPWARVDTYYKEIGKRENIGDLKGEEVEQRAQLARKKSEDWFKKKHGEKVEKEGEGGEDEKLNLKRRKSGKVIIGQ